MRILMRLKKIIKKRLFLKFTTHGENLTVSHDACCSSSDKNNILIGKNCDICGVLHSNSHGKITIGNYSTIRYNSKISAVKNVSIGNHVIISNNVKIYDHNSHPIDPKIRIKMCKSGFYSELWKPELAENAPVVIEDNVWLGEHSAVLKGVKIGKGAIVASHAVVTKDVPPYTIVAGNPAVVVKELII